MAIDFGANQGFYTYYLAALGMQVHSFEINVDNFKSLQHGAEFNSKEVSDRVHLYPVGIGAKNARFGMEGNLYEGFLSEGKGPILGATFDCFAHHTKDTIDLGEISLQNLSLLLDDICYDLQDKECREEISDRSTEVEDGPFSNLASLLNEKMGAKTRR